MTYLESTTFFAQGVQSSLVDRDAFMRRHIDIYLTNYIRFQNESRILIKRIGMDLMAFIFFWNSVFQTDEQLRVLMKVCLVTALKVMLLI